VRTISEEAQKKAAERVANQDERARDGRKAMTEYEAQARATRAKTERLKALRLAKEALVQPEESPNNPTASRTARNEMT